MMPRRRAKVRRSIERTNEQTKESRLVEVKHDVEKTADQAANKAHELAADARKKGEGNCRLSEKELVFLPSHL